MQNKDKENKDNKGIKKNKKLKNGKTLKQEIIDKCIMIASIVITLVLATVIALNTPVIAYTLTENGVASTKNISVMEYYKSWKPLVSLEGTLKPVSREQVGATDNKEKITNENGEVVETETEKNDGLDLTQIIEGQYTILFLGLDESGKLSDVDWVFQIDLLKGTMNVLQIPRDSYMDKYASRSTGKFNSIYWNGDQSVTPIQRVVNAVQDNFGFAVDAYVTLKCQDIANIVDSVGGIPITLPQKIVYEADKVLEKGPQTLSGKQAEWFVRFRHDYSEGDIGRVKAQRIFMAACFKKAFDMGRVKTYSALKKIYDNQWVGTNLSIDDIGRLCDLLSKLNMNSVNVYMLPGEGAYKGDQSVWSIHKRVAIDLLNSEFRPYQSDIDYDTNPIVEVIPEGSYISTAYDNQTASLQEISDAAEETAKGITAKATMPPATTAGSYNNKTSTTTTTKPNLNNETYTYTYTYTYYVYY